MQAIHSYMYMRYGNEDYQKTNNNTVVMTEEQKNRVPDVVHPLIRTHPLTGQKSLYLGGGCISRIEGMSFEETRELITDLFEHVLRPENQFAHKWRPGDLVIWDNRTTMHTATEYDRDRYRRLIWRTSVIGEAPF
jgi:taurine dioxygenase